MARTRLLKPLSEAATKLQERIEKAIEIAPADAARDRELALAERGEKRWRDYNIHMLRELFTTDEYADEYAASVIEIHPVKDRYFDPDEDDIRARLVRSVTQQLNCLASIRDRLELIQHEETAGPRLYSCFISYSSKDEDFANRIHADLQNNGVRCWFAPHDLRIGEKILDGIYAAIQVQDKLLLILSEHSIRSDRVEDEVNKAFEEERKREQTVLFPIRLDDAVMETSEPWAEKLRTQRNIGDFRDWKDHSTYNASFQRLIRDLAPKSTAAAIDQLSVAKSIRMQDALRRAMRARRASQDEASIPKKYKNTLIGTLRKAYGADFAHGCSDRDTLGDVLQKLDAYSCDKLVDDYEAGRLHEITRK
jgi:hypothetical protein